MNANTKLPLLIFLALAGLIPTAFAHADYYAQGTMKSENLLSGARVTDITDFEITSNIPANTAVSVSFSQDSADFYSSSGTKWGWDSCSDGTTNIDISGLGWSGGSLFYKLKLETTDEAATPTVSEVELTYDGEQVPPPGNPHYHEGTMLSADLLDGIGGEMTGVEYFGYGIASLPYGTNVYAQFSNDGTNFYSSSGTAWGWDTLEDGDHTAPETALSLSGLDWKGQTSFYYKLKFTSTVDSKTTPAVKKAGLLAFTAETGGTSSGATLPAPVAYWKFDEGYGDTAHDSAGDNDGTLTPGTGGGNTTATAMWDKGGKVKGAMEFDGTDDYVEMAESSYLDIYSTMPFAMFAWIKTSVKASNDYHNTIMIVTETGQGSYDCDKALFINKNGYAEFFVWDGADKYAIGTTDVADNQWHLIGGVYNGSSLQVYVDGKPDGSPTSASGSQNFPAPQLVISYNGFHKFVNFLGLIDEVKIFNYALTIEQVKTEYNLGKAVKMGAVSTESDGKTPSWSSNRGYCIPGDTAQCDPPVLELKMDEKQGAVAYDTSGRGNNGSISGASWTRGKLGSALEFDGVNDYVDTGKTAENVGLSAAEGTFTAWVKFNATTTGEIISTSRSAITAAPTISLKVYTGSWLTAASDITADLDTWYFIVGVWGSNGKFVYVNGLQEGYNSNTSNIIYYGGANVSVGSYVMTSPIAKGEYVNGIIDQVRVYDYERTPAQIAWDYNRGKPVGWWKFNETSGSTAHNDITNTLHATLYNMEDADWTAGHSNNALIFDGTDEYADIGDTDLNINALSFWIYTGSATDEIIDLDGGTHTVTISSGQITTTGFSNPTIYIDGVESTTLSTGAWHHISIKTATAFEASNMDIGRIGSGYFAGKLDEIILYNYEPTAVQIKNEYNAGAVNFQ